MVGAVEAVAKIVGEPDGSQLTRILAYANWRGPLCDGATRWKRLAAGLQVRKFNQRDGRTMIDPAP